MQLVKLIIQGRGKLSYLTGSTSSSNVLSANYDTWEVENAIVMAWLVNAVEPHIGGTFLFYNTAKEI